jgi:hypothetical protein
MKARDLRNCCKVLLPGSFLCIIAILFTAPSAPGQSSTISFPTPIYNNEISGIIRARDIGDSRLTSYFYTFQGNQGDVFMNVVTTNFNGDIDVFLAEGLKPLTKVPVYVDNGDTETGRVIYLRKPEKLILRIEGRSPNDDPATFQIKFAGSFEASRDTVPEGSDLPKVDNVAEGNIRVNSVGTIIAVVPKTKSTPKPTDTVAEASRASDAEAEAENTASTKSDEAVTKSGDNEKNAEGADKKTEVIVTENVGPEAKVPTRRTTPRNRARRNSPPAKTAPAEIDEASVTGNEDLLAAPATKRVARTKTPPKSAEPDPFASIYLVIEFKDGRKVERPMSEVLRFSVDRGILTVVAKDGTIGRYPILDVARTTIQ